MHSTVRCLGFQFDDALNIAENIDLWGLGGRQKSSAILNRTLLTDREVTPGGSSRLAVGHDSANRSIST